MILCHKITIGLNAMHGCSNKPFVQIKKINFNKPVIFKLVKLLCRRKKEKRVKFKLRF